VKENVTGDEDEATCISKLVVMGFTTAGEGRKRSAAPPPPFPRRVPARSRS